MQYFKNPYADGKGVVPAPANAPSGTERYWEWQMGMKDKIENFYEKTIIPMLFEPNISYSSDELSDESSDESSDEYSESEEDSLYEGDLGRAFVLFMGFATKRKFYWEFSHGRYRFGDRNCFSKGIQWLEKEERRKWSSTTYSRAFGYLVLNLHIYDQTLFSMQMAPKLRTGFRSINKEFYEANLKYYRSKLENINIDVLMNSGEKEVFNGRTGHLSALALARSLTNDESLGNDNIGKILKNIIMDGLAHNNGWFTKSLGLKSLFSADESNEEDFEPVDFVWKWEDQKNIGSAQGYSGILYFILYFFDILESEQVKIDHDSVLESIHSTIQKCISEGFVQWPKGGSERNSDGELVDSYHGASGWIPVFCHRLIQDRIFNLPAKTEDEIKYESEGEAEYKDKIEDEGEAEVEDKAEDEAEDVTEVEAKDEAEDDCNHENTSKECSTLDGFSIASQLGECIWHRGLTARGLGLSHGIGGNGLALLTLCHAEGSCGYMGMWYERAKCFAEFGIDNYDLLKDTQQSQNSLFDDQSGFALFLAVLENPKLFAHISTLPDFTF